MAETKEIVANNGRPKAPQSSKSFTRMDTSPASPLSRKRASTLQEAGIPAVPAARRMASSSRVGKEQADVFENRGDDDDHEHSAVETSQPEIQLPSTLDELPIEIRSLTERFLDSLSAKVHPSPLNADKLSHMFQEFYERAAASIATHIASLSSRIGREKSPEVSASSKPVKGRSRAGSGAKRTDGSPSNAGGEMLTASEVADRKKARKLLELKRLALEEAVERAVCEKVYDRIWKHRSTEDDARDEKLRSRTAALALVGIGLKELHVDSPTTGDARNASEEKEGEVNESLTPAREALRQMDDEHYPLGKLQHLTAAHKSIVESLSQAFPSSSSADEILPTLIYTLITSPPEGVNVVSNLNFIQRFRASTKVDGEAAYCLVNLEAAISFLETVDLSSLRADELPEGPPKSSDVPSTPILEKEPVTPIKLVAARTVQPDVSSVSVLSSDTISPSDEAAKALPSPTKPGADSRPPMGQRRISALVQAQADRIEAGRENFLTTADKIYDSINGTLENSLQFVFGRFKDQTVGDSPLPKTLEDARRLVNSPRLGDDEDGFGGSGRSTPTVDDPLSSNSKTDGKLLELVGGRKQLRDRSVDSARSGGSGKRVAFAGEPDSKEKPREEAPAAASNLFANMNPLNRFSVPSFARFGNRAGSLPATPGQPSPSPSTEKVPKLGDIVESPHPVETDGVLKLERQQSKESAGEDLNAREALAELRKLKPPKKRFLDVQAAGELKISEVEELLLEYRRLAKAIGEAIAS